MTDFARRHLFTLKKTASYYVMHITVAMAVAYLVTGDAITAITLSLLEPTVQAVAFFFHEKAWDRAGRKAQAEALAAQAALTPSH